MFTVWSPVHHFQKKQTETPPAEGKGSLKNEKDESAKWAGSHHFIWWKLTQRHLSFFQKRPSNPETRAGLCLTLQCHLPPAPPPCPPGHTGHTGLVLLQHTAPFPAAGPWSLLFPLPRILFLPFFSWHPPSITYDTHFLVTTYPTHLWLEWAPSPHSLLPTPFLCFISFLEFP